MTADKRLGRLYPALSAKERAVMVHGNRRLRRVVYEDCVGAPLSSKLELHHLCGPDTRACCRPEHLQPMSKREHLALHKELRRSPSRRAA